MYYVRVLYCCTYRIEFWSAGLPVPLVTYAVRWYESSYEYDRVLFYLCTIARFCTSTYDTGCEILARMPTYFSLVVVGASCVLRVSVSFMVM